MTRTRDKAGGSSISTFPVRESDSKLRRLHTARQILIGLLAVFVLLGMTGMLGSRTSVVTASSGGYQLTVTYPGVTRPGLPVRWIYAIRHPGGFNGKIDVATTFQYLNLFDLTGIDPDPFSETATGSQILWSFDPPSGDAFSVAFDAAAEAGVHEAPPATASLLVDGKPVVQVSFKTVVVP